MRIHFAARFWLENAFRVRILFQLLYEKQRTVREHSGGYLIDDGSHSYAMLRFVFMVPTQRHISGAVCIFDSMKY